MWPSRRRNEVVRLFGRRVFLIFLLLVTVALFSGVWKVARKERESGEMKREAQGQLDELVERQRQLSATVEKLQTDRGREEALRQQYALASEGEEMIVIVDPPAASPSKATTTKNWITTMFRWW